VVFIWTSTRNGMYKFSCRKGLCYKSGSNLGLIVRGCAESVGGIGGGHKEAAACMIPPGRLEQFVSSVKRTVLDPNANSA
jgi:nanoRNase/pAp phosphatase (c-di-AMP/oligoRNAs hydrolase)